MMRGPVAYDDGYISRKMSQMQTQPPPVAAANGGPMPYGRPHPQGYMQSGNDPTLRGRGRSLGPRPRSMVDQIQQRSQSSIRNGAGMAGSGALPAGSLTGNAMQHVRQLNSMIREKQRQVPEKDAFITPYLWPEAERDVGKKGWYRADFGPERKTETYFLPNPSDRLNFLQKRSVSPAPNFTTMESPLIINPPQVRQPMKQRADMFADNVQAETVAMNIENAPRSRHRHRMLDDIAVRAKSGMDGYSNHKSYYWQYPHYKGLATRRTASLPRRHSMIESCPVHGGAIDTCDTRATEVDGGYPPMGAPMAGPPPMRRMPPPPPPMYYPEYDYGYGGGYDYYGGGYAYPPAPMAPPPMPRMSRYEQYLEEDPELAGMSMGGPMAPRQSARPRTPPQVPTPIKGRGDLPPSSMAEFDQRESEQKSGKAVVAAHSRDMAKEPHSRSYLTTELPESEGERHLAKMSARYPSFSEPQMLQDHVDKMRIRLKSLAYSLDPTGPVPEIVIPDRQGGERPAIRSSTSTALESFSDSKAKHTMALEYKEMPNLSTRRSARTYPEDEYMKDNLRIKCLSHYKTTRTAADSEMGKAALPDSYASKYASKYQSKWEEPDTIYGSSSDKKPFSKPMAEICPAPEPTVERKKSKSKKTKEEPLAVEPAHVPSAPVPEEPVSFSAVSESSPAEEAFDPEADEKEKKKLEKKKRKAEREAAAKAAMEAELAALAAAEAELARLEQESASLATPAGIPAEDNQVQFDIPAVEVQSEFAAEQCESSNFIGGDVGVSVSSEEAPQQVMVQVVPEPMVTVVEPPTPVLVAPPPQPEEEQQQLVDSTAAAETSQ